MLHAIIMAGGSGTRFWPQSRAARPKQLLPLAGGRSMLRNTLNRLGDLVAPQRVVVATTQLLAEQIAEELPELPAASILAEPAKRNTAPCVGLAALHVLRDDPEAVMAVMPADHVVADQEAFRRGLGFAAALVEEHPSRIVTFGIAPSYPAESFGYIERGEAIESPAAARFEPAPPAYRVKRFCEKPDAERARQFVEAGTFYWNAGIFVWKAQHILDQLALHEPELHAGLMRIAAAWDTPQWDEVLSQQFKALPNISVDYAVLERADNVVTVEAPFDWDDLGSWQALARLRGTDDEGNTVEGRHLGLRTGGCTVLSTGDHLVATVGVEDLIVVHTPDATLVANKHDEESVREVVKLLKERGWEAYL